MHDFFTRICRSTGYGKCRYLNISIHLPLYPCRVQCPMFTLELITYIFSTGDSESYIVRWGEYVYLRKDVSLDSKHPDSIPHMH